MTCCKNCFQLRLAAFVKTCIIEQTKDGYTVWNQKKTRRFGTYKSRADAEKRLEQIHYFGRISKK